MDALVLQHIACEPPGVYEDVMLHQGVSLARVELDEGEPLPDWREFDLIVAMGGPMSVNDDDRLPWLSDEKRLIRDAVRAGVPFFGACLGAQLLAASLGGRVYEGPRPEVGFLSVDLTKAARSDPLFAHLPSKLVTFQWHGDTFTLPRGGVRLASSPEYRNQAFRWGNAAYGLQFHLEVSAEMAHEWAQVPEYAAALERVLGARAGERLLGEFEQRTPQLAGYASGIFERWLEQARATAAARQVARG